MAGEIIAYVEQAGIDLVTMATRGRSGIDRFVMGSIAEKVIRGMLKPVLLIRALPAIRQPVDWREMSVPPVL